MIKKLIVQLAFLSVAAASQTAFAQTETETETESTEPTSEVLQFRNWAVRCAQDQTDNGKRCFLFQRLNTQEGQTLLTMSVGFGDAESDATIAYQLPLGTALQAGVSIQVDDIDRGRLGYSHCFANGCYAFQTLHADLLAAFKAGKTISISFNSLQNQTIKAPVSLYGFSAGYATLEARRPKTAAAE